MGIVNSEEHEVEFMQPAWLWSIISIFGILGIFGKEVLKTALWLPWALYELLRGNLGPHVRNGLLLGLFGVGLLTAYWYFISGMLQIDPAKAQYWGVVFWSGAAAIYLAVGIATRNLTKHYGILK